MQHRIAQPSPSFARRACARAGTRIALRADHGQPARRPPGADASMARQHGDAVVASIFVNRLQFGAGRGLRHATRARSQADCDDAAQPPACDMRVRARRARAVSASRRRYTRASRRRAWPTSSRASSAPATSAASRTVVLKLFNLRAAATWRVFGKKDYQQLHGDPPHGAASSRCRSTIVRAATRCARPTAWRCRSRNGYLDAARAPGAPLLLSRRAAAVIRDAVAPAARLRRASKPMRWPTALAARLAAGLRRLFVASATCGTAVLGRRRWWCSPPPGIGSTRLIDNLELPAPA
ncbi:MAG: pantoate--beta-alanine ligase [Comamonadaceae bacterium]|nr:pantoate--beta-alanine ligase [Comamonadaceae bacterium]